MSAMARISLCESIDGVNRVLSHAESGGSNNDEFWEDVGGEGLEEARSEEADNDLSPLLGELRGARGGQGRRSGRWRASEEAATRAVCARGRRALACWLAAAAVIVGAPLLALSVGPGLVQRAADAAVLSLSALDVALPPAPPQAQLARVAADVALDSAALRLAPLPVLLTNASFALSFVPPAADAGGECALGEAALARVPLARGRAQRVASAVALSVAGDACFSRLARALLRERSVVLRVAGRASVAALGGALPLGAAALDRLVSLRGMGGLGAARLSALDLSDSNATALRARATLEIANPADVGIEALGAQRPRARSPAPDPAVCRAVRDAARAGTLSLAVSVPAAPGGAPCVFGTFTAPAPAALPRGAARLAVEGVLASLDGGQPPPPPPLLPPLASGAEVKLRTDTYRGSRSRPANKTHVRRRSRAGVCGSEAGRTLSLLLGG